MLNQSQLKQDLKAAFTEARDHNGGEDASLEIFTDRFAEILVKHMKTIQVVYVNGLTAGANVVVGNINHTVK